jgi:anti-sigma factor RsiW
MKFKDLLKDAYKEGMTLEEIESALADVELPEDQTAEVERLKAALSKSNSENAEWKKKHREAMSEEERKAQETADLIKQLQEENATLTRDSNISKHKARFLGMGYEESLANDAAVAMTDGDMEKVFSYQQKHQEALEKKIRADALKSTPKPVPDKGDGAMTLEKLRKMSEVDRYNFSVNNPDEYKALYGGK